VFACNASDARSKQEIIRDTLLFFQIPSGTKDVSSFLSLTGEVPGAVLSCDRSWGSIRPLCRTSQVVVKRRSTPPVRRSVAPHLFGRGRQYGLVFESSRRFQFMQL